ncbi:IS630 family transposase [Streptomyces sp. H27-H1]|uniref:IS630 family transposase n=1 Tax=Streptomyces sp. H27-H1 TaxID=2996461 RepID=UPI00226F10EC|nr:IS630 family transposase [Streptomyces sp. H27-H1]MCY0931532.1 IS630 family transposase [Streptomyces sp. H27-H1]
MRRLSPAAQEDLRLRVVAALESGRVRTYGQAAEVFGVSTRSVGTWWRASRAGGRPALLAVVREPRAGKGELIDVSARGAVLAAMRDYTPADVGQSGVLWTRASVRTLIKLVCGVVMTEQGVGKWLRRYGFTPQRPARRSYRQRDDQVQRWLEEEYPAIRSKASQEKAELVWADQCGLRSDTAPPGRSWAPAGQTPLVRVNGRRFRVNIMSAVASRGALWFTVFPGKFNAKVMCAFLDRLARQAGRKVHVIVDRHPVHRSKAVRAWLADNAERVELHLMPGYSPELNPDELLNADLKHHVHAARATSADDLARETRRFLHRRQRQPRIVCGYFAARHVRYTLQ